MSRVRFFNDINDVVIVDIFKDVFRRKSSEIACLWRLDCFSNKTRAGLESMWFLRRMMRISRTDKVANEELLQRVEM